MEERVSDKSHDPGVYGSTLVRNMICRWRDIPLAVRCGALLLFVVIGAYLPALWGGFVWDDNNNIVGNDRLRQWHSLLDVFLHPAMWSADLPVGLVSTYRPLALATMVLDFQVWGLAPAGFHLTNILFHGASQLAVFGFLVRLLGKPWPAFALSLLSGLHPTGVEAIAWVNGRSEPIALFFGALSLWVAADRRRLRLRSACAIAALIGLSLLGKETGAVFIVLAVLVRAWRPGAVCDFRELMAVFFSAMLGFVLYLLLRYMALGAGTVPSAGSATGVILLTLGPMWFRSLQAAALPLDRSVVLVGSWVRSNSEFENIAYSFLSLVLLVLLAVAIRKERRLLALGFSWWLAALLPTALLVLLDWPGLHRWLYLGLPGLLLGCQQAWSMLPAHLTDRSSRWIVVSLAVFYFVLLQLAIPVWRSNPDLYYRIILENPTDSFGYQSYGINRYNVKDYPSAEILLRQALEIDPRDGNAAAYLSMTLARRGACAEAERVYRSHPRGLVQPGALAGLLSNCVEGAGQ